MTKKPYPKKIEDKLDLILEHIEKMDKRDRLRTIGGFIRGLIGLIPIIFLVGSAWYVFKYGDDLLIKLTQASAEAVKDATTNSAGTIMQKFENIIPR